MDRLVHWVNRIVIFVTRHWLALVNGVLALVLGLAFAAPWLMEHGYTRGGEFLYFLYRPLCHQLPERSFFVGGPQAWYSFAELSRRLGAEPAWRYIGNPQLGFKVAFCERDTAIFAGYLVFGLAFGLLRRWLKPQWWHGLVAVVLAVPMAIDGGIQLVGIVESNWQRRTVTGLLFALGVVWVAFPLIEKGMKEAEEITRRSLEDTHAGDG